MRAARGFLVVYLAFATIVLVVVAVSEQSLGQRITTIEHTRTVELCSTKVSCRRLLDRLFANATGKQRNAITLRLPAHTETVVSTKVTHQPNSNRPSRKHRTSHRGHRAKPPRKSLPAPAVNPPQATATPASTGPSLEVPPGHGGEPPGQTKKHEPLGLCIEALHTVTVGCETEH